MDFNDWESVKATVMSLIIDSDHTVARSAILMPCTEGQMGGSVFIDTNFDGQNNDDSGDIDLSDIEVANGEYSFTDPSIVNEEDYRIEFNGIPDGYSVTVQGTSGGTESQFVSSISCSVDLDCPR